ncbi:MAG: GGDEF domain-containing protein [Chromatiales bacterium]|nr:GGDEF domain-containing protein [Chromatiales bacterium]
MPETTRKVPLSPAQLERIIAAQAGVAKLGMDFEGIIAHVARESQAMTGADGAVVELLEDDEMVYAAVTGIADHLHGLRLKRDSSLSGLCVTDARVLYCDDSETDERVDREACRKVGLRSMIVVPLIHAGEAVGVLKVMSCEPSAFGAEDARILLYMSELIAAAMYNAERYSQDELFRRATTDELTGLANRALFHDRLRHAIGQARRDGRGFGVMVVDMDGLKQINDTHGHSVGDIALRTLATRLVDSLRQADTVARLGGDEFGVILTLVSDRDAAACVEADLTAEIEEPLEVAGQWLTLEASLGMALYPADGETSQALLEVADQRMYEQKRVRQADRLEVAG